jgi:hypothetical protein
MRPDLLIQYTLSKRMVICLTYAAPLFIYLAVRKFRGIEDRSFLYVLLASVFLGVFASYIISFFNYVSPVRMVLGNEYIEQEVNKDKRIWPYDNLLSYSFESRVVQRDEYFILTIKPKEGAMITMGLDNARQRPKIESLFSERGLPFEP